MLPIVDLKDSVNTGLPTGLVPPFQERTGELKRASLTQLQINLGKLCNQTCTHCHVDAGPTKTRENMSEEVAERIVELTLATPTLETVDITGGAPEMNPHFPMLVKAFRGAGLRVIDRCNLTILSQPGYEWVAPFLAEHSVDVVASLPCYLEDNVDAQRGDGVFEQSIAGLRKLNRLGYGQSTTGQSEMNQSIDGRAEASQPQNGHAVTNGLKLDLVYNPTGPSLPPDQQSLEDDYHRELKNRFGIHFNSLYAITNIPIRRYAQYLKKRGQLEQYLRLLSESFNPAAVAGVMCRSLISISWDGRIYDCDFNQMIELGEIETNIWDLISFDRLVDRSICLADHCYGCTAGAGSTCSGSVL